jgi:WD40 repeat protein
MIHKFLFSLLLTCSFTVNAALVVDQQPLGVIQGQESLLNHPEGIAFSPSGDVVAIANAKANNVLFYRTADCLSSALPQIRPAFVLESKMAPLDYPHDVAFSPDGQHLAVVSSRNNCIMIYKKNSHDEFFEEKPMARIAGKPNLLKISAVKYHPNGNCLAVCDVSGNKIALYRCHQDTYESIPFQLLTGKRKIIDRPDGVAFSSDGRLLAITSHGVHSALLYEANGTGEGFHPNPVQILQGPDTHFCYTHSLSFHPRDNTLAVSSAGGTKTLALFQKTSDQAPLYSSAPLQVLEIYNPETIHLQDKLPEEGGVKGVAFSPDGHVIGVCVTDIGDDQRCVIFYSIQEN